METSGASLMEKQMAETRTTNSGEALVNREERIKSLLLSLSLSIKNEILE